jgi:hypothetical protein
MLFLFSMLQLSFANDSLLNKESAKWKLKPQWEIGFIAPLQNDITLGKSGTDFDYLADGGEDNLFRYQRFEMHFIGENRHQFSLLFQPFDVTTTRDLTVDTQFDNVLFPAGTPMEFRYGFDFYRGTYSYQVISEADKQLNVGLAMQIRNATLDFRSQNGELYNSNRDIGPVPLAHVSGQFDIDSEIWWGFDLTGAYAPIKYINGSNSDVVGAIIDTSLRSGLHLKKGVDSYVNLRYIAGGAEGTDSTPDEGKDGYVANWLQLLSLSVGFSFQ